MPPVVHLVLVVISLVCFGLSAYIAGQPTPDPLWRRLVSIGAAVFVAATISW